MTAFDPGVDPGVNPGVGDYSSVRTASTGSAGPG